jgi:hypothetical protein
MKVTTTLRFRPRRVIDALSVDRSWEKRRELTAKSSGRNPNRPPRQAVSVIVKKAAGRRAEGAKMK